MYDSLLGFHMGEPDLFVRAAKFLMKYAKDVDLARKTLFKGIRLHKRNPTLYQEFFKIELDFAAKKRRQAKEGKLSRITSSFTPYPPLAPAVCGAAFVASYCI